MSTLKDVTIIDLQIQLAAAKVENERLKHLKSETSNALLEISDENKRLKAHITRNEDQSILVEKLQANEKRLKKEFEDEQMLRADWDFVMEEQEKEIKRLREVLKSISLGLFSTRNAQTVAKVALSQKDGK